MKTLGIVIDGTIRDYVGQFGSLYRKKFIYNPSIVGMNDDFTIIEDTDDDILKREDKIKRLTAELINEPVNSDDMLNHYKFNPEDVVTIDENGNKVSTHYSSKDMMDKFINDTPFQLFAKASQIRNAMSFANRLQDFGLKNNMFNVVLIGELQGPQIQATLFFLSECGCRINNIRFVKSLKEKWEHCDVLIDTNTPSLEDKPDGKISIKVNSTSNIFTVSDYSINSLKELLEDETILKSIFNN